MRRMLVMLIVFGMALLSGAHAAAPDTEPYDRIVLKDMTVIKASLVKEAGDSLAYFELGDNDFIKHTVARDQVFKWVKATPAATASPAPAPSKTAPAPKAAQPAPAVRDSLVDNTPVADYQAVLAHLDSVDKKLIPALPVPVAPAKAAITPLAPATPAAPVPVTVAALPAAAPPVEPAAYDPDSDVPEDLTRVRLDPPTGTEGVRVVPRSGMLAININPTFSSLGAGLRGWNKQGFGFGVKGALLWGSASGFMLNAEIMQALNAKSPGSRVRWYLFFGGGYQWSTINIDMSSYVSSMSDINMDLSFASYNLGLGAEWRAGINRNHGFAIEVGYQRGSADYTYTQPGYTVGYGPYTTRIPDQEMEGTFELMPVYFGFTYAYYF